MTIAEVSAITRLALLSTPTGIKASTRYVTGPVSAVSPTLVPAGVSKKSGKPYSSFLAIEITVGPELLAELAGDQPESEEDPEADLTESAPTA